MYTIIHAVFGYVYLLLTVRVLSRRPGAQMTPFEFVLIFLIGGVIILTTVGDDCSETNAVVAVIAVGLHRLVSTLAERHPKFGAIVYGIPLIVYQHGEWQPDIMRRMRLQQTDLMAAARAKGVRDLPQIKYAILERNGAISIIQKK